MKNFRLYKSDYKIICGYLIVATIWLIINFYVEGYRLIEYFIDIPVFWLHTIILLYISKVLINSFLVKSKNYFALILLYLFSFWIFGFLASISGEITRSEMIKWNELPPFIELIFININSSAANLAIPLTVISAKKYYEYQLQSAELDSTQKELELKALKSQFSPHFLYNSLNTIDALIDYSSKKKVKEYIYNLSGLYRYLIVAKDEDIATLEAEINLARNYCYLIETRFEDDYQFIIPNNCEEKYLPQGSLLTALENVVKHNRPQSNKPILTTIFINESEIKISNSISIKNTNESLGTGLINLKKRYELLSNQTIVIEETQQHFSLTLPLIKIVD